MKILVLTPGIYPDRHSGLPKAVYHVAKNAASHGHEVVVLTRQYDESYPEYEVVEKMAYHRMPMPQYGNWLHSLWPIMTIFTSRKGQSFLKERYGSFDVIWVHNPWWAFLTQLKKIWPQAKIYYDFHSDAYSEMTFGKLNALSRLIGKVYDSVAGHVMRRADFIIAHSDYTKKQALRVAGKSVEEKIRKIPLGADEKVFYPTLHEGKNELKLKKSLPLDRPVFITARGLKPRTGVDKLIEAAGMLKEAGLVFHVVVIGRGVMQRQIEEQISSLNLTDSITMLSDVTELDLAEYYRASDVFVLPTQGAEGFGLATVEALASGLVVLGTDNSATPEILEDYSKKWIIDGCKAKDIFEKMKDYCKDPQSFFISPPVISELTSKKYKWSDISRQYFT